MIKAYDVVSFLLILVLVVLLGNSMHETYLEKKAHAVTRQKLERALDTITLYDGQMLLMYKRLQSKTIELVSIKRELTTLKKHQYVQDTINLSLDDSTAFRQITERYNH